jgi:hypothetical protein
MTFLGDGADFDLKYAPYITSENSQLSPFFLRLRSKNRTEFKELKQ